jgi:hypothetical protein
MRAFTKHVITALKEDEWELKPRAVRHVKSRLVIDTDEMQPCEIPYKFTWFERRVVGHYIKQLQDRTLMTRLIEYRLNPKKPSPYPSEDRFI